MNIESLNRSQIVLLTLLVSFVTSIATGIVTVSLMDQAPPAITQTINRVVEHTVERIVPAQQVAAAAVAPIEKTIIVKQSEAVAQAVGTVSRSVMRIVVTSDKEATPIAIGVAVSASMIATDNAALKDGTSYSAVLSDGTLITLGDAIHAQSGITLLPIAVSKTASTSPVLIPVAIAHGQLQLGQVAVALTGLRSPRIATGIITSLSVTMSTAATSTEATTPTTLETNISLDSLASGTPFVDADGALIGMYTIGTDSVVPATVISSLLTPVSVKTTN